MYGRAPVPMTQSALGRRPTFLAARTTVPTTRLYSPISPLYNANYQVTTGAHLARAQLRANALLFVE